MLSRRQLLGSAVGSAFVTSMPALKVWGSEQGFYEGPLLVTLQLDGGADVTQLCDPKINVPGEQKINHWADTQDVQQVGNLQYAPVANNQRLFERFGPDMLVINGVDSQTNSHETGRLYSWTGSNAEGKPSLSALHAAFNSPSQPLAYCVHGGHSRTANIIDFNRFEGLDSLRALTKPRTNLSRGGLLRPEAELAVVEDVVASEVSRILSRSDLTPMQTNSLGRFTSAREKRDSLAVLDELIPPSDQFEREELLYKGVTELRSDLRQQMQSTLLVFKSGLGSSADIMLGGFDSHNENDIQQEVLYSYLTDALFYFWDYAEELGLADRILLVIGSDFGRTNYYNDGNGKDHWPIGSYMIMEKNAPWGNRVVGLTDELHFAKGIDPQTLKEDSNGVYMTPAHVHKAIQQYMGFDLFAEDLGLGLNNVESLPLFDPFKATFG